MQNEDFHHKDTKFTRLRRGAKKPPQLWTESRAKTGSGKRRFSPQRHEVYPPPAGHEERPPSATKPECAASPYRPIPQRVMSPPSARHLGRHLGTSHGFCRGTACRALVVLSWCVGTAGRAPTSRPPSPRASRRGRRHQRGPTERGPPNGAPNRHAYHRRHALCRVRRDSQGARPCGAVAGAVG